MRSAKSWFNPTLYMPQGFISVEDSFEAIIYDGTVAEWNAVEKDANWYVSSSSFTVICTDGKIEY